MCFHWKYEVLIFFSIHTIGRTNVIRRSDKKYAQIIFRSFEHLI